MDQQALLIIIAVFTGVAAVALLIQAGTLYGTYKASKALRDSVMPLVPKISALVDASQSTLAESKVLIVDLKEKSNYLLESAKKQMSTIESLVEDASVRTRRQLAAADVIVDDVLQRTHQTVELVHTGVMKPLRSVTAVAAGVRAALEFLMRGTRPNPDQVTVDEEMFI